MNVACGVSKCGVSYTVDHIRQLRIESDRPNREVFANNEGFGLTIGCASCEMVEDVRAILCENTNWLRSISNKLRNFVRTTDDCRTS